MENIYDFCTQNRKWQRNFFMVVLILGIVGILAMLIFWLIFKFEWGILVAVICILAFVCLISSLGLYVWYKEKFYFKNETFTYIKPFKKSQSAVVSQILRVETSLTARGFLRVDFIGKNGEKLLSFLDDGTAFRNNYFERALFYYNIPIVRKYSL